MTFSERTAKPIFARTARVFTVYQVCLGRSWVEKSYNSSIETVERLNPTSTHPEQNLRKIWSEIRFPILFFSHPMFVGGLVGLGLCLSSVSILF